MPKEWKIGELGPEDECPNCRSGTLGLEEVFR